MSLAVLAEALARVEYKLDSIIKALNLPVMPMQSVMSSVCPVCSRTVTYQMDIVNGVVVRKCDCSTGKLPPTLSLLPNIIPGVTNGYSAREAPAGDDAEDSSRR